MGTILYRKLLCYKIAQPVLSYSLNFQIHLQVNLVDGCPLPNVDII